MKCVRINANGTMNDLDINLKKKTLLKLLEKESISKGSTDFKELYKWKHNQTEIYCYGWYDGEAGFENKHDLIPNGVSSFLEEESSEKLLFGDIFLVAIKNKKFINFCVTDYSEFYEILFDFEDCESDDTTNEEEEEEEDILSKEDEDFIVDDDDDDLSDESYEYCEDDELDIDENNYTD